jgi:hypothetical protein
MRALLVAASVALIGAFALPAQAQVVRGDQLVAQANFVSRQQTQIPQVSITVRADFVLFSVRYESGTRSEEARATELEAVFRQVTQRAARAEGITIEVGTPGNSAAIETAALKELISVDDDRSSINLVLKIAVRERDTFETIRTRTEQFVAQTPLTGRVEAVIGDNQFLGVSEPKKHRDTLIRAIAEDVRLMQSTFTGGAVQVSLTGMENRVQTRPVGPLDLEIYIPYSMSLSAGQAPAPR